MSSFHDRSAGSGRQVVVAALSVVAILGAGACSGPAKGAESSTGAQAEATARPAAAQSTARPTGSATAGPADDAPGGKATTLPKLPKGVSTAKPKDPLAPKTIKQVIRNGKKPHPTVKAEGGPKPFTKPVSYGDGLKLRITKISQGKISGHGPGVFPGRPVTTFHLTLTNGSPKKLTLGVVVVTATYGEPARLAHLVYDPSTKDFSGAIKPGGTAKAVYGFSVPPKDLNDVTMTVDIDGAHQLATFTGTVNQP